MYSSQPGLTPNHAFLLDYALRHFAGTRILDYGCGYGDIVTAGVQQGLDICGVEVFYGGATASMRDMMRRAGLLGTRVFEIDEEGPLPFPDESFDFIFADQVFEHVRDLRLTLRRISRVLKTGGTLLSLFPSRDVFREGHCGVPFAHRLSSYPKLSYAYLVGMRGLGLGHNKNDKTREQWARDFTRWLHDYCFYRTRAEIDDAFADAGLATRNIEWDYIQYRLPRSRIALFSSLAKGRMAEFAGSWLCRKLGGMVLLSTKTSAQGEAEPRRATPVESLAAD